jgi:acetyl esterase/lipase
MSEDRSVLDRPAAPPDEVVAYGNHPDQVVDIWHGGGPVVVLLHGGFWRPQWDRTHLRPMAGALREDGWTVAVPEYRRVPGRPDDLVSDVRTAIESLPAALAGGHSVGRALVAAGATDRPLVAGHSAGGHLALLAAAWGTPAGVLALAPVADLVLAEQLDLDDGAVRDFLGAAAASRPDIDPVRLEPAGMAVTVLHGTADDRVPAAVSASYGGRLVRRVPAPGADHFALIDPASAVWPLVTAELRRLTE